MVHSVASTRVRVAAAFAQALLEELPQRWAHTIGVADRAARLAGTVDPDEQEVLLVAAWLHDIGYGRAAQRTGFHPLDGARHLDTHGWPQRISALVAHHSGAHFVAQIHGLSTDLDHYPREHSPVADALTYADQTTSPTGEHVDVHTRMNEMLARHGPNSPQARVHDQRRPYLLAVTARVQQRLSNGTT
jgi:putative nucleotidyltransferase with HDIG domain